MGSPLHKDSMVHLKDRLQGSMEHRLQWVTSSSMADNMARLLVPLLANTALLPDLHKDSMVHLRQVNMARRRLDSMAHLRELTVATSKYPQVRLRRPVLVTFLGRRQT